jgi:L-aminopeptidase/D-esterase-like protein
MASRRVRVGDEVATVAALAVVNAAGSPIDPGSAAPWTPHPAVKRPASTDRTAFRAWQAELDAQRQALNTTIGVVATDARLDRPEAARLALAGHDGLARSVRPAHLMTDGDTVFALATGAVPVPHDDDGLVRTSTSRAVHLSAICTAAAEVFALACTDAVVRASAQGDAPSYIDLCPSAART